MNFDTFDLDLIFMKSPTEPLPMSRKQPSEILTFTHASFATASSALLYFGALTAHIAYIFASHDNLPPRIPKYYAHFKILPATLQNDFYAIATAVSSAIT
jgi:hypothetical protein